MCLIMLLSVKCYCGRLGRLVPREVVLSATPPAQESSSHGDTHIFPHCRMTYFQQIWQNPYFHERSGSVISFRRRLAIGVLGAVVCGEQQRADGRQEMAKSRQQAGNSKEKTVNSMK